MVDSHTGGEGFNFDAYDKEFPNPLPLNQDMLRRRMIWDIVPCSIATQIIERLGLSPASPDVEDTEHQEAHTRAIMVSPVAPVVLHLAGYAAEALIHTLTELIGEEAIGELSVDNLHPLILTSTMAIIGELADVGAVHVHPPMMITEIPE